MDRDRYDENMNSLLENRKTYRKLMKDPTASFEWKMNTMLLCMK